MPNTLAQLCTPRQTVFDPTVRDTVYNIDDLAQINPQHFFAENYVTVGMRQLLAEAFKRLEGKSKNTSGAFLLSQSMGGGKTHNLLPSYEARSCVTSIRPAFSALCPS
jgi:chromosomal replication initiation ATPase DnaA